MCTHIVVIWKEAECLPGLPVFHDGFALLVHLKHVPQAVALVLEDQIFFLNLAVDPLVRARLARQ